jgi:hypothetical protein
MDTPLHALAVPDAGRSTLKRPGDSAQEILDFIGAQILERAAQHESSRHADTTPA